MLHLLGSFIGSCGFSSLEQRPEFWVLQEVAAFSAGPEAKILSSQHRGPGSIPGQGTGSHMLQLKTLPATTKTQWSQLNKYSKVEGCSSVTIENFNILAKEKK